MNDSSEFRNNSDAILTVARKMKNISDDSRILQDRVSVKS